MSLIDKCTDGGGTEAPTMRNASQDGPASYYPSAWSRKLRTLQDVVAWNLCAGCGACAYACPKGAVTLVNIESTGIRPTFTSDGCGTCRNCLTFCPGSHVNGELNVWPGWHQAPHADEIGPYLEIWEGHATDPEIRFKGSSGGVLSALALYCLERENMAFVSHAAMDENRPWENRTVQSRSRAELLSRAGSRYSPSSPCDGLQAIEDSDRQCVFIGKPCDAEAVGMLRRQRPALAEKLGLVMTFFCAGTPSTRGTLDLLNSLERESVNSVRYRGEGWPGEFKARYNDSTEVLAISYEDSWGRLTRFRPLRCHVCPDGLGQVTDITCGDAWNQFREKGEDGQSIVIVRTRRGQSILRRALDEGYLELQPSSPQAVIQAQPSLLGRRAEVPYRLAARSLLLTPSPEFRGFFASGAGSRLSISGKIRTIVGTVRRLICKGQWHPRSLTD